MVEDNAQMDIKIIDMNRVIIRGVLEAQLRSRLRSRSM